MDQPKKTINLIVDEIYPCLLLSIHPSFLVWLLDLFDIMSSAWLEMMHCKTVVELIKVVHYATTFPD